jgi:hypothetical protein
MSEVRDEHDPDRVGTNGRQSFECLRRGPRKSAKQSNEAILL